MIFLVRLFIGWLTISSAAFASTISGTYVGSGANNVALVQLVETSEGHLTGRYEHFILQPDGKTEDRYAAITGVRDGEMVVLTIKPAQILSTSITASGTCANGVLHLSGGAEGFNIQLNLIKADEADFRAQVAALAKQSDQINQTRQRDELVARINDLVQKFSKFAVGADGNLQNFAPVEQRYRLITENMRRAYAQAQSIHGDYQASVARSQIYVAIIQASVEAEQLHVSVQSVLQDFQSTMDQISPVYIELNKTCQIVANLPAVPADLKALSTACRNMSENAKKFQRSVAATQSAFSHIEDVWRGERQQQERIAQAANASH